MNDVHTDTTIIYLSVKELIILDVGLDPAV